MEKKCPYTICIDRLELVAASSNPFWNGYTTGKIPGTIVISDSVKLIPYTKKSNPSYDYIFEIWLHDKEIAYLYCGDNNRLRYSISDSVRIEMQNHVLYDTNLSDKLNSILSELSLKFYKYAYAEIAIDGYDFLSKQKSLMQSSSYHRKQPLEIVTETINERTNKLKSIGPGSKKNDRYITIYDKQNTIQEEGKIYIQEFWEMNGLYLVPDKQINRIELRLKRKQVCFLSQDFSLLSNEVYLSSFFKKYGSHYLEYINNKQPRKRKYIIDWSTFKTVKLQKPQTIKAIIPSNQYKQVIKKLFVEFRNSGLLCYQESYEQLASTYHLSTWLQRKISNWEREYHLFK
jgi:hypothetical protein